MDLLKCNILIRKERKIITPAKTLMQAKLMQLK